MDQCQFRGGNLLTNFWGVDKEHQQSPDMTKCSLPQLSSYVTKTLLSQGLLQTARTSTSSKVPVRPGCPEQRPTSSFVTGLSPPHSVIDVGDGKQDWLNLLHLIATHRPAHLQHEHTTILHQVGDVLPVRSLPSMWEQANVIMLGKFKQGEVWIEGSGGVPCPEVCRKDDYQVRDGYLIPANNQFVALNKTNKYNIVPAKGERIVVTYLDETRAHCFLPACSPHQEVLSGPSIFLPSPQAHYKERT